MKKKLYLLAACLFACVILCGCGGEKYKLIRIHIRADSNLQEAQSVKLKVRDSVNSYITSFLIGVTDYSVAYKEIGARLDDICLVANGVLRANGFSYGARARLNNEFFPTRAYDGVVVDSGYYDALIIELGSGEGDNWWCVIYPPMCYVSGGGTGDVKYKSWLREIWEKTFG